MTTTIQKGRVLTTSRRSTRSPRRAFAALAAATAVTLALAACTGSPEPVDSTTAPPPPQYPAQPDFATVLDPAAFAPAEESTAVTFTGSYADKGTPYDAAQIMNASQGGYSTMTNSRWFADKLPQLSEMGFEQVRIDHVLDDVFYHVVNKQSDGSIAYDFTRLDDLVLSIVAQGFQPLLVLSYTPTAFGKSANTMPSLPEWTAAVTAVVSHYRDLGYTGWDWEVWNEPDHDAWTAQQYISLYEATAPAVKAADPTSRVGGATAAFLTSDGNISGQFIDWAGANRGIPVDFFSVHSYLSSDWEVVASAKGLLAAAGLDLPVLITEWALNPTMTAGAGQGSDTNSSPTGAAYVARRLAAAATSGAERVFYFSPAEGFTYSMPYNGDLGLITVDGHRKSIGNVFEMYAGLGDTRVALTATGAATENQNVSGFLSKDSATSDATVLLWNNTSADATASVTIDDLPFESGNVRIAQRVISATQGNGFSDASTVVAPSYPSANENVPTVSDEVVEATSTYTDEIIIPAYGVVEVQLAATDLDAGSQTLSLEPTATNLAAAASGAAVSATSSTEDPATGWGLAAANDGRRYSVDIASSTVRGWSSQTHPAAEATESLTLDLGAVTPVDSVSLWPYTPRSAPSSAFPLDAEIKGSVDGETWTTLATVHNEAGARVAGEQTFSFDPAEIRFITVEATNLGAVAGQDGAFAFALAEIEAYRLGVSDGGFEAADLATWDVRKDATVQGDVAHRGQQSLALGRDASATIEIRGLRPNTTYTVGAYVKASAGSTATLTTTLPVSGEQSISSANTGWSHRWLTFTTGALETSVEITLANTAGSATVWIDDVSVSQTPTAGAE